MANGYGQRPEPHSTWTVSFISTWSLDNLWVDSKSIAPATGEKIGECFEFTSKDTMAAITAANNAFQSFRHTRPRERSRLLRKWYHLMIAHQGDLSVLITSESGKALVDAKTEVSYAASFLAWYSEEAARLYGDVIPASNSSNPVITLKEPAGVCALITP